MASKKKQSGSNGKPNGKNAKRPTTPPPPDLEMATPERTKRARSTTKMLHAKATTGDKGAAEALKRITASFEKVNRCKEKLAEVRSERSKALAQSAENLRQSMEIAVEATAEDFQLDAQLKAKLRRIESAWLEQEETKAIHLENKRDAEGDLKRAQKLLEESVVEGRQLRMAI